MKTIADAIQVPTVSYTSRISLLNFVTSLYDYTRKYVLCRSGGRERDILFYSFVRKFKTDVPHITSLTPEGHFDDKEALTTTYCSP